MVRDPVGIYGDSLPGKSPPGLPHPAQSQNNEGVIHHTAGRFVTRDTDFQQPSLIWHQTYRRIEDLLVAGKLVMGKPY